MLHNKKTQLKGSQYSTWIDHSAIQTTAIVKLIIEEVVLHLLVTRHPHIYLFSFTTGYILMKSRGNIHNDPKTHYSLM